MDNQHDLLNSGASGAELISAGVDAEVDMGQLPMFDAAMHSHASTHLQTWDRYHLIGEALRGQRTGLDADAQEFLRTWHQRLGDRVTPPWANSVPMAGGMPDVPAANDGRWHLTAAMGAVLLTVVVSWQAWLSGAIGEIRQVAQASRVSGEQRLVLVSDAKGGMMVRDPQIDAFLARHKQLGGASALQMPAGFLRGATFTTDHRQVLP
jgi:sigma-E factor negative regulatory protein RseA